MVGEDRNVRTAPDGAEFLEVEADMGVKTNRELCTACLSGAQGSEAATIGTPKMCNVRC